MLIHFKTSLRRILRNRTISFISIFGLTLGLSILSVLVIYIHFQTSFDHFHSKSGRIYKVISSFLDPKGVQDTYGISFGTIAEEYSANFEQVERTARCYQETGEIEVSNERFNQIRFGYVDFDFFQIFDFGVQKNQFTRPDQVILNRTIAQKLFGANDVLGQNINYNGFTYQVTGLIDIPINSQFQFDAIVPLPSMPEYQAMVYQSGMEFHTFVLLKQDFNNKETLSLLADHYNRKINDRWENYEGETYLIPLKDLHLASADIANSLSKGNVKYLRVIGILALFILILAVINYTNFQIAGAQLREKEIGLRKVIGASRMQLSWQIITESLVIVLLSGILGLIMISMMAQVIDPDLIDPSLLHLNAWPSLYFVGYTLIILFTGLLAGIYPAFYLTKVISIRSSLIKPKSSIHPSILSLVVVQFLVSALLLVSILVMNTQLTFMKNMSLGYDQENVLIVKNFSQLDQYHVVKEQLQQLPGIEEISLAQSAPGGGTSGQFFQLTGAPDHEKITVGHIRVLDNYLQVFDIELLHGNDFDYDSKVEHSDFIVNEAALKLLGNPEVGVLAEMGHRKGKIIGVVKDYHYQSLHHKVSPLVFTLEKPYRTVLAVKMGGTNLQKNLSAIEKIIQSQDVGYVMDYYFLDEHFDRMYKNEIKAETITTYAAGAAILLSLLGVMALSVFLINVKRKELAIRKIVGARLIDLIAVLGSKILFWILVGSLASIPLAWYTMRNWLDSFSYRIELVENLMWIGPMVIFSILVISILSILNRLLKACFVNPVTYLKDE